MLDGSGTTSIVRRGVPMSRWSPTCSPTVLNHNSQLRPSRHGRASGRHAPVRGLGAGGCPVNSPASAHAEPAAPCGGPGRSSSSSTPVGIRHSRHQPPASRPPRRRGPARFSTIGQQWLRDPVKHCVQFRLGDRMRGRDRGAPERSGLPGFPGSSPRRRRARRPGAPRYHPAVLEDHVLAASPRGTRRWPDAVAVRSIRVVVGPATVVAGCPA